MDNKEYYEQYEWSQIEHGDLDGKISKLLELIPEEVSSIIDIGCGNGVITNELAGKFKILGVDRSAHALQYVKTDKLQASCDHIPLDDKSFDLVLSSEMLEHLDNQTLDGTIAEMKRLSRRFILLTVPNRENLRKFSLKCPECKKTFNHSYHLQSFSMKSIRTLFTGYSLIEGFTFGPGVRSYNRFLSNIKMRLTPSFAWYPYFAKKIRDEKTMCPFCETRFVHNYRFHLLAFGIDVLNVLISAKRPYWIFMLFEKDAVK